MPIVSLKEMLEDAVKRGYAVGYFEAWNADSLEAVLSAAEEMHSPVILGFGSLMIDQQWFNDWGLEYFAAIGSVAASRSRVPVCLILNEAKTYEQCLRGIDSGFNVVMLDSSHLPFKENVELTGKLVSAAHSSGVAVEGELGRLPQPGDDSGASLTDPGEARKFVERTGVDALSVSIGNVHTLTKGEARVDLELLRRIREATQVPLVIHGGTGFPKKAIKECIRLGVAKFNIGTILKRVYYEGVKKAIEEQAGGDIAVQEVIGSRKSDDFTSRAKENIKEEVKRLIKLYNSDGKQR